LTHLKEAWTTRALPFLFLPVLFLPIYSHVKGIGWHEARVPTIATSVPRGAFSFVTRRLKQEGGLTIPLCTTNRINMPQVTPTAGHEVMTTDKLAM
jgi:hypothetical protein